MKTKRINKAKAKVKDTKFDSEISKFKKAVYATSALAVAATGYSTSAQATVGNALTDDDNINTAYNFNIHNASLSLLANVGSEVYTIQTGAIIDGATKGNILVITHDDDTLATNLTIASIIMDQGDITGVFTITDATGATGDLNVTVTGITDTNQLTTITALENTNAETVNVTFTGATTFDKGFVMAASGSGVKGSVVVNVVAAATFTGGATIGGGTDSGDGSATMKITGAGAQIITGAIGSQSNDFTGDLAVTYSGTSYFCFCDRWC